MSYRQSRTTRLASRARTERGHGDDGAKPRAKRRRLDPATRKAELLKAAISVFAKRGLSRATHADVAEESGCSLATVFVYFPRRDDLVAAVLEDVERFYTEILGAEEVRGGTALDALRASIDTFTRSVSSDEDRARIWLEWATAVRDDTWPRYLAFQERVVTRVGATIERGKRERSVPVNADGDDAARLLIGAAHMLAQMKFSGQPETKIARFVRTLTAVALGLES